MDQCCGTCRFYIPPGARTYTDIKNKVRTDYCRLSGKDTSPKQGKGCLGWKQADEFELQKRKAII